MRTRVERTIGVMLVVLLGAAALMLAAHQPSPAAGAQQGMTSKVVAPSTTTTMSTKTMPHGDVKPGAKAKSAEAVVAHSAPVTITGCLEQDNDEFKLKDTEGADAPQSRSWKSGFIKKHNASVTVLDASNRLKLEKHVGERVSVTGPVVDKEMQARSLSKVGSTCG